MKILKISFTALLLFFFIQLASAGETDDFCTVLKEIMAASKEGFKSIQTANKEEKDDFFGKVTVYQSSKKLPGAQTGTVNKGIKLIYQGILASDDQKTSALNDLYYKTKDKIEACLGSGYKFSQINDDLNNVLMFKGQSNMGTQDDLYQPVVSLRYGKDGKQYVVAVEVEEPFFGKK